MSRVRLVVLLKGYTYEWKLRNDDSQGSQEIDREICQVVMCVMCAEEKQKDGNAKEKLLRWRILVPIVDLLPHIKIVVGTGIELKGDAPHPVKHKEGAEHVSDVGEGP